MPFLTEEIYQKLPNKDAESIVIAPWPLPEFKFEESVRPVETVKEIIRGIRNTKAELNIPPSTKVEVFIKSSDEELLKTISVMTPSIKQLAKVSELHKVEEVPPGCVSFFLPGVEVYVKVGELIDVAKEIERIKKKLSGVEKDIKKLEKKLSNENFLRRAPKEVVEKNQSELAELREIHEKLSNTLRQLENLL